MEQFEKALNIPMSIMDLVDLEHTSPKSLFYQYKDKKDIGKKIFVELMSRFHVKSNGFYMDDTDKSIGVLSQCQSLQSLLLLASSFGLDFDDETLWDVDSSKSGGKSSGKVLTVIDENGEEKILTIRRTMDLVIADIIKRLNVEGKDGETSIVFDASPYRAPGAFDSQYAYVDAITWVIPTFLLVLRYHIDINEVCRFERELIEIIKKGIDYLNEAYIQPTDESDKKLTCGWNFTKDCEEPSLYFTFAVTECYVDLFSTFEDYIRDIEAVRDSTEGIPLDEGISRRIAERQADYDKVLTEKDFSSIKYVKDEVAFFDGDKYNEMKRIYMAINDGEDGFDSRYGNLEKNCKQVASMVWPLVKQKFADYFFFNDLHATVTEEDIRMSTTNDALFNSVYIINILLNTGLDEEINKKVIRARLQVENLNEDEEIYEAEFGRLEKDIADYTNEYNKLLDTCQYALQKALRVYENLKNESREYIVDQFLVGFNERLVKLETKVRELRKLRIRIFSLVPLFIKTNSVISEYLVRYPQNSMKKYLGYILDNRFYDKNKNKNKKDDAAHWIWEKDGFFSASNYYYVSALGEFYSYYEEYEQNFIENDINAKNKEEEHQKNIDERDAEIRSLKKKVENDKKSYNDLKDRSAQKIADLQKALDSVDTSVEAAVRAMIDEQMKKSLSKVMCDLFNDTAAALTAQHTSGAPVDQNYQDVHDAVSNLAVAFMAKAIAKNSGEYIYPPTVNDSAENHSSEELYEQLVKDIRADMDNIASLYVHSISRGANDKTSLLARQLGSR